MHWFRGSGSLRKVSLQAFGAALVLLISDPPGGAEFTKELLSQCCTSHSYWLNCGHQGRKEGWKDTQGWRFG